MKTHARFKGWTVAMALISLPLLCSGADDLEKPSSYAAPPALAKTNEVTRLNLDVVNGLFEVKPGQRIKANIDILAGWIRERMPGINLVLSPGAGEIPITNLRLRSASLEDFLQALTIASDGRV